MNHVAEFAACALYGVNQEIEIPLWKEADSLRFGHRCLCKGLEEEASNLIRGEIAAGVKCKGDFDSRRFMG